MVAQKAKEVASSPRTIWGAIVVSAASLWMDRYIAPSHDERRVARLERKVERLETYIQMMTLGRLVVPLPAPPAEEEER